MGNQKNDSYGLNNDRFIDGPDGLFGAMDHQNYGPTILMEYDIEHPEEILGKTSFKTEQEAQNAAALVAMANQWNCKKLKKALSFDLISRNSVNQQGRIQYMQCYTMSFNADLYKQPKEKSGLFGAKKDNQEEGNT